MAGSQNIWTKAAMEMVGTGLLLAVISIALVTNKESAPNAIGALLVGLIYMGFELSGAHYNPAVTLTFYLRNRFTSPDFCIYATSQFIGGFFGALFATLVSGKIESMKVAPGYTLFNALFAELLFTIVLCFSILTIALRTNTESHPLFGVAIAGVIYSGALLAGPISGGAFNPVVILVLSILDGFSNFRYAVQASMIHLLAAAIAATIFYAVAPKELRVYTNDDYKRESDHDIVDDLSPLLQT